MKVSPGKVLLVMGLAVYGYSMRGEFGFSTETVKKKALPVAAVVKELTPEMVNRLAVLQVPRDPFTGAVIHQTEHKPVVLKHDSAPTKPLGPMTLQGVAVGPEVRFAIINGKTLREGEPEALEEGAPRVTVKSIGNDYAVVQAAGQVVMLRLELAKTEKPGAKEVQEPPAPLDPFEKLLKVPQADTLP